MARTRNNLAKDNSQQSLQKLVINKTCCADQDHTVDCSKSVSMSVVSSHDSDQDVNIGNFNIQSFPDPNPTLPSGYSNNLYGSTSVSRSSSSQNISSDTLISTTTILTYNKKVSRVSNSEVCVSCSARFKSMHKSIRCFLRSGYFHIECVNVSKTFFNYLEKNAQATEWICPNCRGGEIVIEDSKLI